ncbi:MAG: hypothetical protein COC00_010515 [Rhizobiales bacterium]|nr:hypothetical protein [Hyphomicrobiales bacterium]
MIHWKNKPIDKLSKNELQDALLQAVKMNISKSTFVETTNQPFIFTLGFSVGTFIAIAGFTIGSVLT